MSSGERKARGRVDTHALQYAGQYDADLAGPASGPPAGKGRSGDLAEQPVHQYALPGADAPERDLQPVGRHAGIFGQVYLQTVDLEFTIPLGVLGCACKHGRLVGDAPSAGTQLHLDGDGLGTRLQVIQRFRRYIDAHRYSLPCVFLQYSEGRTCCQLRKSLITGGERARVTGAPVPSWRRI